MADASRDGGRAYIDFSREDLRRWRKLRECGEDATVKEAAKRMDGDCPHSHCAIVQLCNYAKAELDNSNG